MPNDLLSLSLDLGIGDLAQFGEKLQKEMQLAVAKLTVMTHEHIKAQAQSKLKSSLQTFLDSFPPPQSIDYTTWEISILKSGLWIEEGLESGFNMLPGFLSSQKAKTGKNGKYLVIPFKHNKSPSIMTNTEKSLNTAVRDALKKAGIPYQKLETGKDGNPLSGTLHKMNLTTPQRQNMVGVGHFGPEGKPYQIHPKPTGGEGPGGRPYLWGLSVRQNQVIDKNGNKTSKFQKDIMTFRTASESQMGKNIWLHPGLTGQKFLDSALEWAEKKWESQIKNEVFKALGLKD